MAVHEHNRFGQPLDVPVPGWTARPLPSREPMIGRTCRVEPLAVGVHADQLFDADTMDTEGRSWTYLPYGPFATRDEYRSWVASVTAAADPMFHAIIDVSNGRAVGVASYLRMDPAMGTIEVGHIHYAPLLQRTVAATEAMYLMMRRAFELGYRRYEWKCDALNAASRAAAQRLGLSYEGIFRQARVTKGRNRDTAWYAAIDREWPALDAAFRTWLDPSNFEGSGRQRRALSSLTAPVLVARG